MPVFDFNNKPDKNSHGKCTYTMVFSNASEASAESPILLLDNKIKAKFTTNLTATVRAIRPIYNRAYASIPLLRSL